MHIGIDAQLLSGEESYRAAGVSNYSRRLLAELGRMAEERAVEHRFTAFVNAAGFACPGVELAVSGLPLHRPPARILWEQTLLRRELKRRKIDLIHGLVNVLPLGGPARGVVTVHDLRFMRMPEKLPAAKRLYLQRFSRASVERASQIIAVSRQTADDLVRYFNAPAKKITVIHNGVGAEFTPGDPAADAEFRRSKGLPERFLLYVGTLEPRKNLSLLLKAYARWVKTSQTGEDVSLVLVGAKGWFYDEIFQLVQELALEERVRFPGYAPDAELPAWYRAASGFVYPSLMEGFGLPLLEAMACGTPVLCSAAPSLREVAGDAALTVPLGDETGDGSAAMAALADGLEQLMEDAELQRTLRQRGLARAARFSWRKAALETAQVYERC
jgi:glycosyltransferase involved in cell wall biosynthesis